MADKATKELERLYTIPLRDVKSSPRNHRTDRAIRYVRTYLQRHMKAQEVWIDQSVNLKLWDRGMYQIPSKIRVRALKFDDGVVEVTLPEQDVTSSVRAKLKAEREKKASEKDKKKGEKEAKDEKAEKKADVEKAEKPAAEPKEGQAKGPTPDAEKKDETPKDREAAEKPTPPARKESGPAQKPPPGAAEKGKQESKPAPAKKADDKKA
jgi:large subunit ribosomal protein L31e